MLTYAIIMNLRLSVTHPRRQLDSLILHLVNCDAVVTTVGQYAASWSFTEHFDGGGIPKSKQDIFNFSY